MSIQNEPIMLADRLRWAREHWKEDPTQPRDLDALLLRAAETLEASVPNFWRAFAVIEAFAVLALCLWPRS